MTERVSCHAFLNPDGMSSFLWVTRPIAPIGRLVRTFASQTSSFTAPGTGVYRVFDREAKRLQRDAAVRKEGGQRSRTVDYVRDEVADRLMERLLVRLLLGPYHPHSSMSRRISKGNLIPSLTWVQDQVTFRNCSNPTRLGR